MGPRLARGAPRPGVPMVMLRTMTFGTRERSSRAPIVLPVSIVDAGLAALLLLGTWAGNGTAVTPLWWVLAVVCAAAVAVRRRWPVPAFAVAVLATMPHLAMAAVPAPADLAA